MRKRLISFSLWGDLEIYNVGAVANASAALDIYPGWICRFYALEGAPAIPRLEEFPNTEIILMPDKPAYAKSFWRFLAASDRDMDRVIFRDCDSRIGWKEQAAVDDWIDSDKKAHVMRDVEAHAGELMLSGMWGIRRGVISDMPSLCHQWVLCHDMGEKQTDELFLRDVIWARISKSVLCHGFSYHGWEPAPVPFPPHTPGPRGEYVGMSVTPDDRDRELCKRNAPFLR